MTKKYLMLAAVLSVIFVNVSLAMESRKYYADGTLKSQGSVLKDGKRHGKWQYWYHNGVLMSEGKYKYGKRHGEWVFRNKNGDIISVKRYVEGEEAGADIKVKKRVEEPKEPEKREEIKPFVRKEAILPKITEDRKEKKIIRKKVLKEEKRKVVVEKPAVRKREAPPTEAFWRDENATPRQNIFGGQSR